MMPAPLSAFIAELRRRRVFRVAAFYGGIAFVIVQIIDGTFEVMGIPAWVSRLLIILLTLGFPIAVVFAWVFDITDEGIVRTKGRPADVGRKALPLIGNSALAIITVVAIGFGIWGRWGSGEDQSALRTLAVLPLENQMNDPEQQYFVDGMHDALINELSQISSFRVRSRTSVMGYKGTTKRIPEIAAELNVDLVVEGAILLADNTVRFTIQLIDGQTDEHLMAKQYDREMRNVLALHSEISRAIAESIHLRLVPDEVRRLEDWRSVDPMALGLYLRGRRELEAHVTDGYLTALSYFQKAIDRDSAYPDAYVGLASAAYQLVGTGQYAPNEWMPVAKENALKGLDLDPDNSEAYSILGIIAIEYDYNLKKAGQYFRKSLDLNPSYSQGRQWFAQYLVQVGETERAFEELNIALVLEQNSDLMIYHLAVLQFLTGDYPQMVQQLRALYQKSPGWRRTGIIVAGLVRQGRFQEAVEAHDRIQGQYLIAINGAEAAEALVRVGRRADAEGLLKETLEKSEASYVDPFTIAGFYAALDSIDLYFEWMDRAYQERSFLLPWLEQLQPSSVGIRNDPRYAGLATKYSLAH